MLFMSSSVADSQSFQYSCCILSFHNRVFISLNFCSVDSAFIIFENLGVSDFESTNRKHLDVFLY
jgi:hypothetical protein